MSKPVGHQDCSTNVIIHVLLYQMVCRASNHRPDDVTGRPDRGRAAVRDRVNVCAVTQKRLHHGQSARHGRGPQRRHRVTDAFVGNVEKTPLATKLWRQKCWRILLLKNKFSFVQFKFLVTRPSYEEPFYSKVVSNFVFSYYERF